MFVAFLFLMFLIILICISIGISNPRSSTVSYLIATKPSVASTVCCGEYDECGEKSGGIYKRKTNQVIFVLLQTLLVTPHLYHDQFTSYVIRYDRNTSVCEPLSRGSVRLPSHYASFDCQTCQC